MLRKEMKRVTFRPNSCDALVAVLRVGRGVAPNAPPKTPPRIAGVRTRRLFWNPTAVDGTRVVEPLRRPRFGNVCTVNTFWRIRPSSSWPGAARARQPRWSCRGFSDVGASVRRCSSKTDGCLIFCSRVDTVSLPLSGERMPVKYGT